MAFPSEYREFREQNRRTLLRTPNQSSILRDLRGNITGDHPGRSLEKRCTRTLWPHCAALGLTEPPHVLHFGPVAHLQPMPWNDGHRGGSLPPKRFVIVGPL